MDNPVRRYGYAVLLSLIAGTLTLWTIPDYNTRFFELFQATVVIAAWYGGVGPGLVAATVSFIIIDYYFVPPVLSFAFGPTDFIRLLLFEVVAILTSLLSGKLRRANADLENARDALQSHVMRLNEAKTELERTHDELEIRIAQRTEELSQTNRKLVDEVAQRMEAERAIMEISNREQRRLGQDLHDGISQILTGVKFMTESVRESLADRNAPETRRLGIIEAQLAEALGFVDTVSRGLYPVELDVNGLMAALKELSEKMSRVYPVVCRFKVAEFVSIPDGAVANHVYRIAQELMINAVKGGRASRINVRLRRRDDDFILTVADNGVGFGNKPMRKGMGIKMMEYRARVINGALRFRSRAGGGTVAGCRFPAN